MKMHFVLVSVFGLLLQWGSAQAQQVSYENIKLEQGKKYWVSIKVDRPEDVKKHFIQIGTTQVAGNEELKYNPETGCLETMITIPSSTNSEPHSAVQKVAVIVTDEAGNREPWINLSTRDELAELDKDAPKWISGRATKLNDTTLRVDVLLEEAHELEARFLFVGLQSLDDEVIPLGMNCIKNPENESQKYCSITVTLPKVIGSKKPPFGYLQFVDEAGNVLEAKLSSETEASTPENPRLYLEWPFLGNKNKQAAGKLEPIQVTRVIVKGHKTQSHLLTVKFRVSGNYEYLVPESLLNDKEVRSFLKCAKKDANGVAVCTMTVLLPKVTNQSDLKFQFSLKSDQGGSFQSKVYASHELEVLSRIERDQDAPKVLSVEFKKVESN